MIHSILEQLYQGESLSLEQSQQLFSQIVQGNVEPIVLSSILTALKMKGETPDEIAGAALALKEAAVSFPSPDYDFIDSCGTGGDGSDTINISTASAFVAAACGIKVAKHGNRSVSSKSGSADLLEALGIKLDMTPEQSRECLDKYNLCFLFAVQYHQGVRFAVPVRQALKTRTIFNVLGPLINPAAPKTQLMGVYDKNLIEPIAKTLQLVGVTRALVVNGSGLDELAIHGPSDVAELNNGVITTYQVTPDDLGVETTPIEALRGGDAAENATLITALLKGQGAPAHQNAVAVNVAATLYLSNNVTSLAEGVSLANKIISSGKAYQVVEQLAAASQEFTA
ncbi:anthranilate phosphoribosyltransferase [Psychrobium sp. 1_MG-2023]|uniref:anthranilate phosphoribosyltransferase n=1 Tax=Psychrobium sp. 1_MG-2023 TaxID=3062624 RepID=UPI000C332EA1|nr:anthranilate phosphoribosyltransferase [Psychrobium sp. 1_MG-2023]MDP2560234.1 anthranilate phosphoribosyltransferase [Psychrobium sp. 1_MG-2023]PKF57044.1 anthranilate phosphoribosyltransferase [Alteromonadales bacterium alter-6D02]